MTSGGGLGGSQGEVDTLYIDVKARLDEFDSRMAEIERTAEQTGERAGSKLGNALSVGLKVAAGAALALGAGIGAFIADGFAGVMEGQEAVSQLETTIKSMGNVAGVSSEHLQDFAGKIQETTKFSAEAAIGAQSLLLTFGNIKAEGGVFDRATAAALDMAQALGQDANGAALQLGKALNDPVKGINALSRAGVSFSAEQKETIKTLVKTGETAEAQRLILSELEKQFGGSAVAAGQTFSGQMERAKNALGEVAESIAIKALPLVTNLAEAFIRNMPQIQAFTDKAVGAVTKGFDFLSVNVFPALVAAFNVARPIVQDVASKLGDLGSRAAPVVSAALGRVVPTVLAVADGFQKFSAFAERNKEILIPLAAGIGTVAGALAIHRVATIAATAVTTAWTAATTIATTASVALRVAIAFITGPVGLAVAAITALVAAGVYLYRNWDEVKAKAIAIWGSIKEIVSNAFESVKSYLRGIDLKELALDIVRGLANGILAGPALILRAARGLGSAVIQGVKGILNIQSPSRVMFDIGGDIGAGLGNGIAKSTPEVQKSAAKLGGVVTDEVAKARAELEKGISYDRWVDGLRSATRGQLEHAQALARSAGDAQKYDAIKGELERREGVATAATEKATAALKQQADQLAQNRKQIADGEAQERYVAFLRSVPDAQLASARATAASRGEVERYNAIKAEQERRENLVTAAQDRSTQAAKQAADQLASNRKQITDGLKFDAYVSGLANYTDAQLAAARSNALAAGDGAKFNAVLAAQKTRADEAAQSVADLAAAQLKAANSQYSRDPQGATDSAFRQSYGVGDVGLVRSLAAATGLSVQAIRDDVEAALADARRFAPETTAIIERVYGDALKHRREMAAETDRLTLDSAATQVQITNDLNAKLIQQLKDRQEEEARTVARAVELANERRDQIVQAMRDEAAAADDASITVESLTGQIAEFVLQQRDPGEAGFLAYLKKLTEGSGQAAAAAQEVLDKYDAILFRAQTPQAESGPSAARGVRTPAPTLTAPRGIVTPGQPLTETQARGAAQGLTAEAQAWKDRTEAQERALRLQEEYRQSLQGLTVDQLETAKAQALLKGESEKYGVIVDELARLTAEPLTLTLRVAGIDTGIKALDLYKSAIQGVASVISGVFEGLASGTEVSTGSILKSMALMALGIVKQVAVAIAAYEAQAIALAIISGASFNFVQAGLALAAAAAVAGIVAGLESRLNQQQARQASTPTSSASSAPIASSAAQQANNIQIPTSQVSVYASPEWVGQMAAHIDRFGNYVGRLVGEGIRIRTETSSTQTRGSDLAWELGSR